MAEERQVTEPPAVAAASPDPTSMLTSKAFVVLLLLAPVVAVVVSLAAWGFLELVHQIQVGVFDDLPGQLGFEDGAPLWWPVLVLGLAGLVVAFAIVRLPGRGGHVPAEGLKTEVTQPIELPGVMLAAVATIGLGIVLGPEAPLIALGSCLRSSSSKPRGWAATACRWCWSRALIEALLGQLYLVMGVSGGVANLVPRRRLDGGNSQ